MFHQIVQNHLPATWSRNHYNVRDDCALVELPPSSADFRLLQYKVNGVFNLGVSKIVRVQNPYLYGQYLLKKEEYETRGAVRVHELFHDTADSKIPSIVSSNLDWRLANRVKFGKGVSFSPSPSYANQQSSRSNGTNRAMIVADVLVQNAQHVSVSLELPKTGYDTTVGNRSQVYVKFYDNEFYPKYVIYYESRPQSRHRGYHLW